MTEEECIAHYFETGDNTFYGYDIDNIRYLMVTGDIWTSYYIYDTREGCEESSVTGWYLV